LAVGYEALYSNTIGTSNVALGGYALNKNTDGVNNLALGNAALYANQTGSDNMAVGTNALASNTIGGLNTAVGTWALQNNTTGDNNTAFGNNALHNNTTGSRLTAIGDQADVSVDGLIDAAAIGAGAKVESSFKMVMGDPLIKTIGGFVLFSQISDRRLKENIVYKNDLGLQFINKLKTVSFNFKADTFKRRHDGLIAQDVEQALKDLGLQFSGLTIDDDKDKTENLAYEAFVIPLINAIQEQQKQIEAQQKQIDELKKLVGTLPQK